MNNEDRRNIKVKKKTIYITQTAVMLALLIVVQFVTKPFTQYVTGSLVNLILLVSVFMIGIYGGLAVALISPFLAFIVGAGPGFIQIVPVIAIGNAIFILVAGIVRKPMLMPGAKKGFPVVLGLVVASIVKTLFLWIGVVLIALPLIPGLKQAQVNMISTMFTWPQLITALIGSALAIIVIPLLKQAFKHND